MPTNRIVILDRDGVINQDSDAFVKHVDEWIPIDGSIEAIVSLKQAGYWVGIASNQSGIGRGLFERTALNAMHEKMNALLKHYDVTLDGIAICPHTPDDNCTCRKPKTGLFEQLAADAGHDISGGFVIGDSLRDLQAGVAMGLSPLLVRTGKGTATEKEGVPVGTKTFDDLAKAATYLLSR